MSPETALDEIAKLIELIVGTPATARLQPDQAFAVADLAVDSLSMVELLEGRTKRTRPDAQPSRSRAGQAGQPADAADRGALLSTPHACLGPPKLGPDTPKAQGC
ncbi:MAG: hypothetical protein R2693_09695 [Nocardioidaceae bacterium]